MPDRPARLCPGCRRTITGRCTTCTTTTRRRVDRQRGTAAARGYGAHWRNVVRPAFLSANPLCVLCGELAEVPDHWPRTRRQLEQDGVADPDAHHRMRALCTSCHNRHGERTPTHRRG